MSKHWSFKVIKKSKNFILISYIEDHSNFFNMNDIKEKIVNKMEIPEIKCKNCIHRKNDYCRAYQSQIWILDIKKCKRKKECE
jgi:hypothetical protein